MVVAGGSGSTWEPSSGLRGRAGGRKKAAERERKRGRKVGAEGGRGGVKRGKE